MSKKHISIAGLCLGWMIGMSSSPIISATVSSLLALIIGVVSMLGSQDTGQDSTKFFRNVKKDILPTTLLIFTIALGSCVGILTRTSNILDLSRKKDISSEIEREMVALKELGLDSTRVTQRILDTHFPLISTSKVEESLPSGVLYASPTPTECKEFCMKDSTNITRALKRSNNPYLRSLTVFESKRDIVKYVHQICDCN